MTHMTQIRTQAVASPQPEPHLIQQKMTLLDQLPSSQQMHGFFCRYLLRQRTVWPNPAHALRQLEELMQWHD